MASKKETAKPKLTSLTVDQKLEILDQIGKKSYTVLCEEYGVCRATISNIRKKESELKKYKRQVSEMGMKRPAK